MSPVWASALAAWLPLVGHDLGEVGAGQAVRQAAEDREQAAAGLGHARAGEREGDRGGEVEILAAALAPADETAPLRLPQAQ